MVYGLPVVQPGLPAPVALACEVLNVAIWVAFAVDLAVRVVLAPRRLHYLARHPVDVVSVALPMLRPLRVLRVFTAGQALFTRGRGVMQTGQAVVLSAGLLVLIGSLAILDAERGADGATITSFGDAVWWALTTVTTVGYGDRYLVTGLGRVVAASLMIVGISVLGVVTATVAAWFVRGQGEQDEAADGRAGVDGPHAAGGVTARLDELDALRRAGRVEEDENARLRERILAGLVG